MNNYSPRVLSKRSQGGFTLLEVLISSAILLGLLALLLGACEGTARFWNHAERRRAPLREAGAALRLIDHDLISAAVTPDPSSLLIKKESSGDDSVFFLVSHPSDHRPDTAIGDLCATGYFLAPSPTQQGERDLYRFHASGPEVVDAVLSKKLSDLYDKATPATTNTELLARHVAELSIHPIIIASLPAHPAALEVSITTVDGNTDQLLCGQRPSQSSREELLKRNGARLSTLVSLPPVREFPSPL
jgi:prepilin-type N-terminal cleavage/methylation domain-containing protein